MKNVIFFLFFVALILLVSNVSAINYTINKVDNGGAREYRLYYNNFHFMSILGNTANNGVFVIRPHPGSDINGWGSSLYLQPFLPGATLKGSVIDSVKASKTGIEVKSHGTISQGTSNNIGTWTATLNFQYSSDLKQIAGSGKYSISLKTILSSKTGDLNLLKIASNYLDDVPLLNGSIGDTGDMEKADVAGGNFAFSWIPESQPAFFPHNFTDYLSIDVKGKFNNVDTAKQGYAPIAAAYKPSLKISLKSSTSKIKMIFGAIYDTSKSKDFWEDNVGITPLILKESTLKSYSFSVTFASKALTEAPIDSKVDSDGDGYCKLGFNITNKTLQCPKESGKIGTDCNDTNPQINPGALEKCNGIDDNCDGIIDSENSDGCISYYKDADKDGYGVDDKKCLCSSAGLYTSSNKLDCNDANQGINPGALEICDGKDNNCDGKIDENCQSCITPISGMVIIKNTQFCPGVYDLSNGIVIGASDLTLDCNGAVLRSNNSSLTGVSISQKGGNTIKNCIITGFGTGFSNWNGYGNYYLNNTIFNNTNYGIYFDSAGNQKIVNNTVSYNSYGIYFFWGGSYGSIIEGNIVENNKESGIVMDWDAKNNIIKNNYVSGNLRGILSACAYGDHPAYNNNYTNNIVKNNTYGFITCLSDDNLFKNNEVTDNSYGFYIGGNNNSIYNNNIIDNSVQVFTQASQKNFWDFKGNGNYWSNYDTNQEGCFDNNTNGICDSPYIINSNNTDNFPFVKKI